MERKAPDLLKLLDVGEEIGWSSTRTPESCTAPTALVKQEHVGLTGLHSAESNKPVSPLISSVCVSSPRPYAASQTVLLETIRLNLPTQASTTLPNWPAQPARLILAVRDTFVQSVVKKSLNDLTRLHPDAFPSRCLIKVLGVHSGHEVADESCSVLKTQIAPCGFPLSPFFLAPSRCGFFRHFVLNLPHPHEHRRRFRACEHGNCRVARLSSLCARRHDGAEGGNGELGMSLPRTGNDLSEFSFTKQDSIRRFVPRLCFLTHLFRGVAHTMLSGCFKCVPFPEFLSLFVLSSCLAQLTLHTEGGNASSIDAVTFKVTKSLMDLVR